VAVSESDSESDSDSDSDSSGCATGVFSVLFEQSPRVRYGLNDAEVSADRSIVGALCLRASTEESAASADPGSIDFDVYSSKAGVEQTSHGEEAGKHQSQQRYKAS
jgi:hypothetical protein